MKKKKEKDDKASTGLNDLFSEQTIAGLKIRPFTLDQTIKVTPLIQEMKKILEDKKINFEKNIMDSILLLLPKVKEFFNIFFEDQMKPEDIGKIEMNDITKISLVIVSQNLGYLKNLLGPMMLLVQAIKTTKIT